RHETPAALQRRLDAEEQERQRRLNADALERLRRISEEDAAHRRRLENEEEGLVRRLAIETAAAETKRLADLHLVAEQRRFDALEAEYARLANEGAAERKRLADEEAEGRKDRRGETPRPLVPLLSRLDLAVREVPPLGLAVIRSKRYQKMSNRIVKCMENIRSGRSGDLWLLRLEILLMSRSKNEQIEREGIHLEGLIRALQQGVDLRRPHYFEAVYKNGGSYDD
ncbi:MAG: hypothetical protein NUV84_01420, partial [Candidatus Uhrbacteria bacterium]|nr:hypothetical protein [Candidatus Uhrbacteria bacterium]